MLFPKAALRSGKERQQQPNTETMIRNYSKTIGALAAASALAAGYASAEIEGQVHIGYNSQYIFRGVDLGEDMVEAGADVSTTWNGFGLSAGLWYASIQGGNFANFGPVQLPDQSSELDLYGGVSKDLGFATASIGYIWYHNQDAEVSYLGQSLKLIDDSQEIYFGLNRELFWGINGSLTYYWDIETDNNGYTELALDKTFKLHDCVDLVTSAKLGYAAEEGQIQHTTLGVTLNIKATDTVTVSPYVAYSFQGSALEGVNSNPIGKFIPGLPYFANDQRDQFFGGVKLAVSF
jgi:hypothetical protein